MGFPDTTRDPLSLSGAVHKPLHDPFQESPDPHLLFPRSQGTVGAQERQLDRHLGMWSEESGTTVHGGEGHATCSTWLLSQPSPVGEFQRSHPGGYHPWPVQEPMRPVMPALHSFIPSLTHPFCHSSLFCLALGSPDSAQGSLLVVMGMHRVPQAEPTLNQPFEPLLSLPFLPCTGVPDRASSSTTLIVLTHSGE